MPNPTKPSKILMERFRKLPLDTPHEVLLKLAAEINHAQDTELLYTYEWRERESYLKRKFAKMKKDLLGDAGRKKVKNATAPVVTKPWDEEKQGPLPVGCSKDWPPEVQVKWLKKVGYIK